MCARDVWVCGFDCSVDRVTIPGLIMCLLTVFCVVIKFFHLLNSDNVHVLYFLCSLVHLFLNTL